MTSFNGEVYVCETCHKHLAKNVIPWQAVFNNMEIDTIPYELKYLKCLQKVLTFNRTLFEKSNST